jgi:hypothetical protein
MFTDAAVKQITTTEARGLRLVNEEVLEGVLFDPEPRIRYVITDRTVRGAR